MGPLIFAFAFGVFVLAIGVLFARQIATADPHKLAQGLRLGGGAVMIGVGALVGRTAFRILSWPLMLGGGALFVAGLRKRRVSAPTGTGAGEGPRGSVVETQSLRMTLDHRTGNSEGEVLDGPYSGRRLSELSEDELEAFYWFCHANDPEAVLLIDAWLERLGRERPSNGPGNDPSDATDRDIGPASLDEAAELLGLTGKATADEIRNAFRRAMKSAHPDQGGSDAAVRALTRARDMLLEAIKGR
jgi:hypothetical protein